MTATAILKYGFPSVRRKTGTARSVATCTKTKHASP
jgi:hypothetical protein